MREYYSLLGNDRSRRFLPETCAVLVMLSFVSLLFDWPGANAAEQQLVRVQPLPEKPVDNTPPQEIDQHNPLVPTEALRFYGIDPIITGPVPKARRS